VVPCAGDRAAGRASVIGYVITGPIPMARGRCREPLPGVFMDAIAVSAQIGLLGWTGPARPVRSLRSRPAALRGRRLDSRMLIEAYQKWGGGSDVLWPSHVAQQPSGNVLRALALYLLAIVATSRTRRRLGRSSWKAITTHPTLVPSCSSPRRTSRPETAEPTRRLVRREKRIEICIAVVVVATALRVRWALFRRAAGRGKVAVSRWVAPVPAEWVQN